MFVALDFSLIHNLQSPNTIKNFFLKNLFWSAKSFHLEAQAIQNNTKNFTLELQGEQQKLLDFTNHLSQSLPLSLQWAFKELRILENLSQNNKISPNNEISNFLTPIELQEITHKQSPNFCNLWQNFIDFKLEKITLLKDNQKLPLKHAKDLQESLSFLSQLLKEGKSIFIKTIFGKKELLLLDEKNPTKIDTPYLFMPFCLNNAQSIFRISNEESQALATLEKPIIHLKPKAILKDFFCLDEVPCILPFDPILLLLTKFLESYSGLYLLEPREKIQNGICYFIKEEKSPLTITVAKNSLILQHTAQKAPNTPHPELESFLQTIQEENLKSLNALYLGEDSTHFMVYFNGSFKTPIEFKFETNFHLILNTLKTLNSTTQSLLKNFTNANCELIKQLETLPTDSKPSTNLLDLIGMCGILLDLQANTLKDSTKAVLQCASQFLGSKGPRIDFRLEKNEEGKIYLDTLRTLRSVMSFKLAGVEKELLCFGILDSFAEFFANLSRDMEENYNTKGIIVSGELFLNKQFIDQFIHYLPKDSEIFPNSIMFFTPLH